MKRFPLHAFLAILSTLTAFSAVVVAQDKGQQWAILVGIEKYEKASRLRYTANDVEQLSGTFLTRGGCQGAHLARFLESSRSEQLKPTRETLLAELPVWLAKPKVGDRLLVYFSGHGFRDAAGKLYLAPIDIDPARPEETGISVEWLRDQIALCQASFKLLVIDACHAGSEKGDEAQPAVVSKDLAEPFRDLEGVVTLASSSAEETSQLWDEKEQSLFTYWLNQGLKGHADENGDGQVDIDELNKYVHRNVTQVAKTKFHRSQTPVRIIRSGAPGTPVVIDLAPLSLKQLLADVADQLGWAMESKGVKKTGVLEFATETQVGEALGGEFGALGRYCAAELEQQLIARSGAAYDVVDGKRLAAALKAQRFSVSHLDSATAMRELSERAGGMPGVVLGVLRHRQHRAITLQCRLRLTGDDSLAGVAGGTALLSESEWAMLGKSVAIADEDREPPAPGENPRDKLIERLDAKSQGPHPLADPGFPYRVSLWVNGKERVGKFQGNEYLVPLRKGEFFEIRVRNQSNEMTAMRLLVDGLNTLPEKALQAEPTADGQKGVAMLEVARPSNLDTARHWVLDPEISKDYAVRGFVTAIGPQGKLRRFEVVEMSKSWAQRKNYTDNIGLITAAFYAPASSRSIGVAGEDVETDEAIESRPTIKPGKLLGVVHLRYVEAE